MVRFKHRYLLVHLIFPACLPNELNPAKDNQHNADGDDGLPKPPSVTETSLITLLRESLSANFGDVGAGEVGGSFSSEFNSLGHTTGDSSSSSQSDADVSLTCSQVLVWDDAPRHFARLA